MATEVIAFRMPVESIEMLRRHGIDPAEAARKNLEGLLRSIRVDEALSKLQARPFLRRFDPAKAVREARRDLDRRR